jgi:hemerythrin-like metal-binding protein
MNYARGPSVKWSDDYLTGIERIDHQHKALFQMSAGFREALNEGSGQRVYGGLLKSLRLYARAHFRFEEDCMNRCQCSAAECNTQAHTEFLQCLTAFEEHYAILGFDPTDARRLVEFLDHWLAKHICGIDVQLRPFAQGLIVPE